MSNAHRSTLIALLALLLSALLAPGAAATPDVPGVPQDLPAHCAAPPCGYIWPRISIDSDLPDRYPVADAADFPETTRLVVKYSWDLEQEGTGISDPSQDMKITVLLTRIPAWMDAALDQHVCEFTLVPVITEYEVCTLTLTASVDAAALPASEEGLRETGYRLMLFAASEESGTYMKSYGLEDVRFVWDDEAAPPAPATGGDAGESPFAPLLAVMAVFAAVAMARRGALRSRTV